MGSHCVTTCRLIIILLILDAVICDIKEFFANLPSDVGNSLNNAWINLINAIKRPVRIRRLGRTGKTKRISSVTDPMVVLKVQVTSSTSKYVPLSIPSAKLIIPILATPHWKSMLDWRRQRLGSDDTKRNFHKYERTPGARITSEEDDDTNFGNLFFV